MACSVCGTTCGPLNGKTNSWPCAGILANRTRNDGAASKRSLALRDSLRALYGTPEKAESREAALGDDLRAIREGGEVLDLYGGGLSAEWIRTIRPDLSLTVAESNRKLWPALRLDAERLGFTPVFGDFAQAGRGFDLTWLDLCGEPVTALPAIQMARHENEGTRHIEVLYVTVMRQNRLGYRELRPSIRDRVVEAMFGDCEKVHSYRRAGGNGTAEIWRIGPSYREELKRVAELSRRRMLREHEAQRNHREREASYYDDHARWDAGEHFFVSGNVEPCAWGNCRCDIPGDMRMASRERAKRYHASRRPSFRSAVDIAKGFGAD